MFVRALAGSLESFFGQGHRLLVIFIVDRLASLVLGEHLRHEPSWELLLFLFRLISPLWVNEYIFVEVLIVEILKSHCTSLESFLLLLFNCLFVRLSCQARLILLCPLQELFYFNTLLQENGRGDLSIWEQLPEVLQLSDPLELGFDVLFGLHVRVTLALVNRVANHLAALAPLVLQILLRIIILLVIIFIVDFVLDLVLLDLATLLILSFFAAAPPEQRLRVVLTPVDVATPVEIGIFMELLATILASLDADIDLAFAIPELNDPSPHLLLLVNKDLQLLRHLVEIRLELIFLLLQLLDLHRHLGDRLFALQEVHRLFSFHSVLRLDHLLLLLSELVPLFHPLDDALLCVSFFAPQLVDEHSELLNLEFVLVFQVLGVGDRVHRVEHLLVLTLHDLQLRLHQLLVLLEFENLVLLQI